jgi:hypothetical protein
MGEGSLGRTAIIGSVIGLIAVIVVFLIADAISGPLMANDPSGEMADVPLGGAIFGVVIGALVGTGLAFLLRNAGNAANIFSGICLVALVLYGIYAFVQADDAVTGIWLNVMHIAAAVPIAGLLDVWLQNRERVTSDI